MTFSMRTLPLCVFAALLLSMAAATGQENTVTQGIFRIDGGPEMPLLLGPPVVLEIPDLSHPCGEP